ncbi:MAG: TetR family transcriptional regulator [Actinobacteria bacterium]|nr:TetR family transcriptional regulator [Actinomycetota bacterium]
MKVSEEAPLGLRERKKLQTRSALSWAVIRLSVEHGWANVTVEDAAAAANVSERTFRNYFSSKAEAVAARHLDRMLLVAVELQGRPAGEPLWDAITGAVLSQFAGGEPRGHEWTDAIQLMLTEPDVAGEVLRANATAQRDLGVAIARRTGTDPAHDLYPSLVAATTNAAITTVMDHWLRADPPVAIEALMRDAFGQLQAGLPVP